MLESMTFQGDIYNYWLRTERGIRPGYITPDAARYWFRAGMRIVPGALVLFTEITDKPIMTTEEDTLGRFHDMIIPPRTGDVLCSIVTISPTHYSIEMEMVPLPLPTFTYNAIEKKIFFDQQLAKLSNAPTLPQEKAKDINEPRWQNDLITYWNEASVSVALRSGARLIPDIKLRVSRILDVPVLNSFGRRIGSIADVVVTPSGDTPFAMVEFSAAEFGTDEWYFVPFSALTLDILHRTTILDLKREKIRNIPKFTSGKLSDTSQPDWDDEILEYWDTYLTLSERNIGIIERTERFQQSEGEGQNGTKAILYSDLKTFEVVNQEGTEIAMVNDLLIDVINSDLDYLIFEFSADSKYSDEKALIPIPLKEVRFTLPLDGIIVLSAKNTLQKAPTLGRFYWENIKQSENNSEIEAFWEKQ